MGGGNRDCFENGFELWALAMIDMTGMYDSMVAYELYECSHSDFPRCVSRVANSVDADAVRLSWISETLMLGIDKENKGVEPFLSSSPAS